MYIRLCLWFLFFHCWFCYICMYICVCVCVIPLKFCIVLFHARQILMPQPILIAPRGPHRFIPSGEGASPSPFGPLNARGCVHEPPCGGPPWPPLLPGPRKRKISLIHQPHTLIHTRFCRVRIIFFETFRPYTTYVRIHICLPQALR